MKKITENLLKLSDLKLLEHLQLLEKYILEATWTNVRQFQRHYYDHVLDTDEEFNPDNPKFVHMEEQDYKDMAEKFSELPADKATYRAFYNNDGTVSNRLMNTRSNVIGFILKPDVGKYQRVIRKAKIIKTPIEYLPNGVNGEEYRTLVVYVDEGGEDEIISCYLLRPKKMFGIFKYQFEDELPENQDKPDSVTIRENKLCPHTKFIEIITESYSLIVDKPYMMRNDGKVFEVKYDNRRIADHPYLLRNPENINIDDAKSLIMNGIGDIDWFYKHTNSGYTQKLISRFVEYAIKYIDDMQNNGEVSASYADKKNKDLSKYLSSTPQIVATTDGMNGMLDALLNANEAVNQEFLRFRTGITSNNSTKLNVYFRVSSVGFNWSTLIDNLILNNYNIISDITITKDPWALGNYESYSIKGKDIVAMSIDDWMNYGNNAIIESCFSLNKSDKINKYLKEGLTISEIFWGCNPKHIANYVRKIHR